MIQVQLGILLDELQIHIKGIFFLLEHPKIVLNSSDLNLTDTVKLKEDDSCSVAVFFTCVFHFRPHLYTPLYLLAFSLLGLEYNNRSFSDSRSSDAGTEKWV
jgi:hypothetical protein